MELVPLVNYCYLINIFEDTNLIHFLVTGKELKRINDILGPEHEEQTMMNFRIVPGSTFSKNTLSFYMVDVNTKEKNGVTIPKRRTV